MTTIQIAILVQFLISNILIFTTIYFLNSGFKNKKILRLQYWLSPLKTSAESDKMYNYIITMYESGVLKCSLDSDGILKFEEELAEEDEKSSSIELYCYLPYFGAFNIKKFRDSEEVVNSKPSYELFKQFVDIHYNLANDVVKSPNASVIKLD